MGRRLFQCFQESVESRGTQHMHLINNIHAVFPHLRQYPHLINQTPNIIHAIVRGSIQLVNVQRTSAIKRLARLTLITRFGIRL